MMKKLLFLIYLLPLTVFTQEKADPAYELQRNKVNHLLSERSAKFGQYDQSLNARTGIFGFQTKKDIKNSNEILRQIALTDNEIFRELKILMDYKDVQSQQIEASASNNASRITLYRSTIKQLQDKNKELLAQQNNLEKSIRNRNYLLIIFLATVITACYLFYKRNKGLFKTSG